MNRHEGGQERNARVETRQAAPAVAPRNESRENGHSYWVPPLKNQPRDVRGIATVTTMGIATAVITGTMAIAIATIAIATTITTTTIMIVTTPLAVGSCRAVTMAERADGRTIFATSIAMTSTLGILRRQPTCSGSYIARNGPAMECLTATITTGICTSGGINCWF